MLRLTKDDEALVSKKPLGPVERGRNGESGSGLQGARLEGSSQPSMHSAGSIRSYDPVSKRTAAEMSG